MGAVIAQWLERRTLGGKVAGSSPGRTERLENFPTSAGSTFCADSYFCIRPTVTAIARKSTSKIWVFHPLNNVFVCTSRFGLAASESNDELDVIFSPAQLCVTGILIYTSVTHSAVNIIYAPGFVINVCGIVMVYLGMLLTGLYDDSVPAKTVRDKGQQTMI